ncbi:MAG: molybdopterin-dependent oxidoreductase [Candidatus Rokubacteria bacterium]|nr:molybdopterin-dependent oxidoreductase [Candidatus Rokubacteria bacterium]
MIERIQGYCALCRSRCGAISVVDDGRLVAVEPDASHPTGPALCAKGRAAPELVHHPDRLLHPLRRTRPKGDPDPGWERIGWDEALDLVTSALRRIADAHGPEAVAFAVTSPSGTAISDAAPWIDRFINAFGSPNNCYGTEVCNWHKDHATRYTFGAGIGAPDFAETGCVLYWGHNPSTSWLTHATGAVAARKHGARLIVVDPRRAGLAAKADLWLRVRPGSDGALALGIAGVMIDEGWFDRDFIRDWSNGPLLVREDTGRFLTERGRLVAWDAGGGRPVHYDPATGGYAAPSRDLALDGRYVVGDVACRPAFARYAELCRSYSPERVEAVTWVPAAQVRAAARMLWASRPVSYYCWTGVGQTTNATQTDRAIALLYALTGSFEAPGGNVTFPRVPTADVSGAELMPAAQRAKALGLPARPLGPPRSGWITADDLYRAVLDGEPYRVRALVGFGANLAVSRADSRRGRAALAALEFTVYADLFMTPTAAFADVVLPVTTAWEHENLKVGFEISAEAESLVQLRRRVVAPRGEARSDTAIVFELAQRLGFGKDFWDGDVQRAWRELLAPSGLSLERLRASPGGVRVPLVVRHRRYAEDVDGRARGFATPSGKVEIYSEVFLEHGQRPLPEYVEPVVGAAARPDLAARYPLVLTCAKLPQYCHSQHRGLPSLRRLVPDPELQIHPAAAAARAIANGDWVVIETPDGQAHARARLDESLDARVVCGQHGWWGEGNYNEAIGNAAADPISGSVPHRAYLCEVRSL